MSAYVVIEATARDVHSRDAYASQATPLIKAAGGEILAFGAWQVLFGEAAFTNGMLIHFSDKQTALAWYDSPAYQSLIELRTAGLDCRFRLVG